MPKILNLSERRILGWAFGPKAAGRQRGNEFLELLFGFVREYNRHLSVLAHASFLPK